MSNITGSKVSDLAMMPSAAFLPITRTGSYRGYPAVPPTADIAMLCAIPGEAQILEKAQKHFEKLTS